MTSKAERNRKRKGVIRQRQGRPAKVGTERFKCGKPRPESIEPNQIVIGYRSIMAGGDTRAAIAAAENPLDLAKHRGWITDAEHKAGEELAQLYRRSGMDLPQMRVQDLARVAKGHSEAMGNAGAMERLRRLAERYRPWPRAHAAVLAVCVLNEWPEWMLDRLAGRGDPQGRVVGYVHLCTGLRIAARELGTGSAGLLDAVA